MAELFGTDGIRGVAGEPPLDARTIYVVGLVFGQHLKEAARLRFIFRRKFGAQVLLGEDTRESSPWVTSYLAAGLRAGGVEPISAGVLPTPAIAQLVCARGFAAGVVVSASHNPYRDNGIKLIGASGMKLPDEVEAELEARIGEELRRASGAFEAAGEKQGQPPAYQPQVDLALGEEYVAGLRGRVGDLSLDSLHVVVDCANGAATRAALGLLRGLGAGVTPIHTAPDGKNINANCGALYPQSLQKKVVEVGADLGVAFDGDGDRAIFVSHSGKVVDGDGVLFAAARWMKEKGKLKTGIVVSTTMANMGLEVALRREDLQLVRTAVGDRYVLEEILRRGANLGGEQSGHVIFLDDAPTGDGLLTALKICSILVDRGCSLEALVADLKLFPQVLLNVRVREKIPFEELPAVQQAMQEAGAALGEQGRVLVRYSGTEPVARVMVEAESGAEVKRWASVIAGTIEEAIGNEGKRG